MTCSWKRSLQQGVPESPQRRRRRGGSHHAASETVVEDLKQFIQDRIGEDAFPLRVEQPETDLSGLALTLNRTATGATTLAVRHITFAVPVPTTFTETVLWPGIALTFAEVQGAEVQGAEE